MPDPIRLVTRSDDAGSTRSANRAILEACRDGICRNVSIMVPAPAFDDAAELLKDAGDICLGLHATITDEWTELRWGPVLGPEEVPSLVLEDGTFHRSTHTLWETRPSYDEILAELKAQLDLARSKSLKIDYLDFHMAFEWFDGLSEQLHDFARAEGLVFGRGYLQPLPRADGEFDDPIEGFCARLRAAQPGETYLHVCHPAYDDEEMRALTHGKEEPGDVARSRDLQRRTFVDPRVLACCRERGVELTRYTDLTDPSEGVLQK